MGANLDMITILEARYKILSKMIKEPLIQFAELGLLEYWREVFRRIENPLVIFIDPLPSYIGRGVNDRKNSEVPGGAGAVHRPGRRIWDDGCGCDSPRQVHRRLQADRQSGA